MKKNLEEQQTSRFSKEFFVSQFVQSNLSLFSKNIISILIFNVYKKNQLNRIKK
jgi:hypothetical protein